MKKTGMILFLLAAIVSADSPLCAAGAAGATAPRLGETRIVPSALLRDPFINTKAHIGLSYGRSKDVVVPLIEIEDQPVLGLEGELLFAFLGFEYRFAVREWVAVWIRVELAARLGNEAQSLLAQGVSAADGFELGWLFRLYEDDRHLLSTSIMARNSDITIIDILGWANGVVEGDDISLFRKSPTLGTLWDLRYIYALNGMTALQMMGQLAYSESVDRALGNEWYYGFGGTVSADLEGKTGVPAGLAAGYKYDTVPAGPSDIADHTQTFLLGISYMGRPDLRMNLDLQSMRMPLVRLKEPAWFLSATLSMQYYF